MDDLTSAISGKHHSFVVRGEGSPNHSDLSMKDIRLGKNKDPLHFNHSFYLTPDGGSCHGVNLCGNRKA
jgi:hypothetical protein